MTIREFLKEGAAFAALIFLLAVLLPFAELLHFLIERP